MINSDYNNMIEKMRENFKDIIVASFYKETQVNRSIHSSKRDGKEIDVDKYKRLLLESIRRLRKLVDNSKLKNSDIRTEIKKLSEETKVSVGQSQKVINVYLKFYCLLKDCPIEIIKELDCPLDSTTMEKKQKMKNVFNMDEYIDWQNKFEKEFGIRLNHVSMFLKELKENDLVKCLNEDTRKGRLYELTDLGKNAIDKLTN